MNAVKINRIELLQIVRENKEIHIKDVQESIKDYKKAAIKLTKENLELAKTGNIESISKIRSMPSKPVSYESAYARAIRMLELSVDEVIEVEEDVFNQLVLDEWNWKHSFTASTALYKSI